MKKITSVLMVLLTVFSMVFSLVGCTDEDKNNGNLFPSPGGYNDNEYDDLYSGDDGSEEPNDYGNATNNNTELSAPQLIQLTNTGDIPYEYYCTGLFNSITYGDYAEHFNTELFPYYYNGQYGYADAEGNVVIREQYGSIGLFSEEKAFVMKDSVWYVIDTDGKTLYTMPDKYERDDRAELQSMLNGTSQGYWNDVMFQNGVAVKVHGIMAAGDVKYLVYCTLTDDFDYNVITVDVEKEIDLGSNAQLESRVINTKEFKGILVCYKIYTGKNHINTYALYDLDGKLIWNVTDTEHKFHNQYNKSINYKDTMSKNPNFYLNPFEVKEGYINVPDADGKWGLLDIETLKYAVDCEYDFVGGISEGLIPVCSYGKWGYIDLQGNVEIDLNFGYTAEFRNGKAYVLTMDGDSCFINKDGSIVAEVDTELPASGCRIFRPAGDSRITVVISGKRSYTITDYINNFAFMKVDARIIDDRGHVMEALSECSVVYVSEKYVFLQTKNNAYMYELK